MIEEELNRIYSETEKELFYCGFIEGIRFLIGCMNQGIKLGLNLRKYGFRGYGDKNLEKEKYIKILCFAKTSLRSVCNIFGGLGILINICYHLILYLSYKYVNYKSTKRSGVVRRGETPPKENFYFLKFLSPYPRNLKFFHRCRKIIASPYLPLIPFRQQSSLEEVG